jgi:hypothetical protein
MIRNLKVLLAAAMALAAFGALSASAAHAAEEKFHCNKPICTLTLNPDGAVPSATAHHVFIVKNTLGESISFTCRQLTGNATTTTATTEEITAKELEYDICTGNGAPVKVRMNKCDYKFKSKNGATVLGAEIHIECPEVTKHIEIELTETGCIFEVTPQTVVGAHYHNIGTPGTSSTENTVEARVPNIKVEFLKEGAGCLIKTAGQSFTSEYTTGNTIVTAEEDNASKVMVEGWWA